MKLEKRSQGFGRQVAGIELGIPHQMFPCPVVLGYLCHASLYRLQSPPSWEMPMRSHKAWGGESGNTWCRVHTSCLTPAPSSPFSLLSVAREGAICTPLWEKETGNYTELMSQWAMADSSLTRFLLPVDVRTLAWGGGARQG